MLPLLRVVHGGIEEVLVRPGKQPIKDHCPICADELDRIEDGSCFLDCMHWYHHECISSWFKARKNKCPECRTVTQKLYRV